MLKHEFSWSHSRYRHFKRCRLFYYYHYYASWGGWDQYANERSRQIYLLKNLKTINSWIEGIFRKQLLESIQNGHNDYKQIQRKAFAVLKRDICELRNFSWKEDYKKINLFELYYGFLTLKEIELKSERQLAVIFANFADSSIFCAVSEIPYLNLKKFKRPVSFEYDGIKVWTSPDLIWEDKGEIKILNFFMKDPLLSGDWAFKTGVDAIFAEICWPGRKIEAASVFFHQKEFPFVYSSRNRKEIKAIIRESSNEMLELSKLDTEIKEESFKPTENNCYCESCVYKELCGED